MKQAPPTPLAEQKAALGDEDTWNPEWDKIIEDALPQDLLWSPRVAKELKGFCPRFSAMTNADKRAYWAYFFQALAGAEAGLRSTADVRHTEREVAVRDAVTHRMVRAEGLLQLTQVVQQRRLAVDVQGRAVMVGQLADGHVLAEKVAVTVVEMIHEKSSIMAACGLAIAPRQAARGGREPLPPALQLFRHLGGGGRAGAAESLQGVGHS